MPLSEYEQRVLDEMEAQLVSDDPSLASSMTHSTGSDRRSRAAIGVFLGLCGLGVLVGGMVWGHIWLSLVGFAMMFVAAWIPITSLGTRRSSRPSGPPPASAGSSRSGLGRRLEDRWNRRNEL
ncbi:MAG: DUF3040 domain-containing protein [Micrococcales bacterium]|nr:DUF3040 domain-containing protein [Micrococcales bacterium]